MARETVGEIDQMVGALREDGRGAGRDEVEPPAVWRRSTALVERHRAAGLDVTASVRRRAAGRCRPRVDRAAYRILQEALTNAARHGDGSAEVRVAYDAAALELTVTNPVARPRSGARPGGGHGLVGMRERAALLGGSLEAGAGDGRSEVRARLPLDGSAAMSEPPVRVLIVDDDDLMRAGLRGVLTSDDGIEVVGEAATGATPSTARGCCDRTSC